MKPNLVCHPYDYETRRLNMTLFCKNRIFGKRYNLLVANFKSNQKKMMLHDFDVINQVSNIHRSRVPTNPYLIIGWEGWGSSQRPSRSGPRYGTDRVGQYKTHGIGDSIRAQRGRARSALFSRVGIIYRKINPHVHMCWLQVCALLVSAVKIHVRAFKIKCV